MKNLICLIMCMFLFGCASKFEPYTPPELKFQKTEKFVLDLSGVEEAKKKLVEFKPIFLDDNNQICSPEKAKFVKLNSDEYKNFGVLMVIAKTYKDIAKAEETLINIHIDAINSLKELTELERQKAIEYRSMWVNSEMAYRQEVKDHKFDNFINKTGMYLITVGSIVLLATGL